MTKNEKPLINSVAGEVTIYNSTNEKVKWKFTFETDKDIPKDTGQDQIDDIFGRYGGPENLVFKRKKKVRQSKRSARRKK